MVISSAPLFLLIVHRGIVYREIVYRGIDLLREKKEQNAMRRRGGKNGGDWGRRGRKKRNRDITFARYRLIGITRFSIVSESVPPFYSIPSPPIRGPSSLCRFAYPATWLQSTEVGCNYRLPIMNSTHAVTIRPKLIHALVR